MELLSKSAHKLRTQWARAELPRALEYGGRNAALRQCDGCDYAGMAAADNPYV